MKNPTYLFDITEKIRITSQLHYISAGMAAKLAEWKIKNIDTTELQQNYEYINEAINYINELYSVNEISKVLNYRYAHENTELAKDLNNLTQENNNLKTKLL